MPKRRLRREEDRPKREEVKYLEVEEILEVVNVAKAQRDFMMPRWVDIIGELIKVKSGIDYIGRYVNLVSSLIYSSDNIIFDLEFDEDIEDEVLINLGEKLKKTVEKNFYNLGLDYTFYLASQIGELLGASGIYLSPREKDRVKAHLIYPWDIYFYYPQLDIEDPSQIIVRVIRMGRREAEKKFGAEVVSQAEVSAISDKALLPSELDERALRRVEEIVNKSYGTEEEKIVFEEFYDQFFEYLRYLLFGQGRMTGELVNIYEVWYKDEESRQVCRAVVVGNKVVSHSVNPSDPENYPFSLYISEPVLGLTTVGIGTGDKAVRVQRSIKELLEVLEEATDRFVNPTILLAHYGGALVRDEIVSKLRNPGDVVIIDSPDLKLEEYVPKVSLEALYALIEKKEHNLKDTLGLMSDIIFGGNLPGVRSASHAQLISMFASSHLKQKALRFEKFIEELMTLYGRFLTIYDSRFAVLYNVPFRIEVYAHTSSPIMALNYQEILAQLIETGLISKDVLIELLPIPMKQKLKIEAKKKEELEKIIALSEIAQKKGKE